MKQPEHEDEGGVKQGQDETPPRDVVGPSTLSVEDGEDENGHDQEPHNDDGPLLWRFGVVHGSAPIGWALVSFGEPDQPKSSKPHA
jgi:hypothetical protein